MENAERERITAPTTEPVIAIRLWDVGVVIGASIVVIAGHAMLAGALPWLVGMVVIAIPGYGAYRVWDYHHERALFREARLERYRAETAQLTWLQPDSQGNYPVPYDGYSGRVITVTPGNIIQPVPHTYSPHIDYRLSNTGKELAPPDVPAIAAPLQLPGPVSMREVMRHWDLSPEHLFLALGKGNRPLACSIEEFMHVAHDGPTGSGKTSQWKAELIMLLKADVLCFLANPHFAPVSKKGEDWRPIARALEQQELPGHLSGLLYHPQQIRDFLKWLSQVEIDHRFALMRAGRYEYPPLYGFIDEWAEQVKAFPESAEYMETIIRRGRAVDVCISTNSQGFLVADTGLNSSARENFQTAYDLGSSPVSASAMLDMKQSAISKLLAEEKVALGKGIALLRNNAVSDPAQLVRLPHADNEYVYYMFGRADDWRLSEYRIVSESVSNGIPPTELFLEEEGTNVGAEQAGGESVSETKGRTSVIEAAAAVSNETRRRILRDIKRGNSYRQVAANVGMSGGSYTVFQQVCKDLGYDTSQRNPHSKGGKER